MLGSLGAAGLAYAVVITGGGSGLISFAVLILTALVLFPFFRRYIFRERFLNTSFDRKSGMVTLFQEGLFGKIAGKPAAGFPVSAISSIVIETKKLSIENADAVEFVKKISLQHNTVIPGFGEESLLYLLTLKLTDGTDRIIFAETCMQHAVEAHGRIQQFLDKQ